MSVEIKETVGNILEVRVSGKLTHEDYQEIVPVMDQYIEEHGKIRLIFEMQDFHGWELAALWDDTKFAFKHFHDIERLAMIGETKWEQGMAAFCKPFTTAKTQYFDHERSNEARTWIQEGVEA